MCTTRDGGSIEVARSTQQSYSRENTPKQKKKKNEFCENIRALAKLRVQCKVRTQKLAELNVTDRGRQVGGDDAVGGACGSCVGRVKKHRDEEQ